MKNILPNQSCEQHPSPNRSPVQRDRRGLWLQRDSLTWSLGGDGKEPSGSLLTALLARPHPQCPSHRTEKNTKRGGSHGCPAQQGRPINTNSLISSLVCLTMPGNRSDLSLVLRFLRARGPGFLRICFDAVAEVRVGDGGSTRYGVPSRALSSEAGRLLKEGVFSRAPGTHLS